MSGQVRIEKDGATGWLVFDHLERRNAISRDMWQAIPARIAELDADDDVRVIVMRGAADTAFVSGADISEFESSRIGPGAEEYNRLTREAFDALANANKPLVAMIHGYCIGGGCAISLHADMRYAAEDAQFAIPPARLGLGYGTQNVEALVGIVGQAFAREILFTAHRYNADDALRMGLAHRVLPKAQLEPFVRKMARQIAQNAPLTIHAAKINLGELRKPAAARDKDAMSGSIDACFLSEDYAEGIRAFLEKRPAEFSGK